MDGYRKILVAVDGSEPSRQAFRQACSIAREDKSWVTVITAVPSYQDQFQSLSIKEKAAGALKAEGHKILDSISAIAKEEDIYISTVLEEGVESDVIADFCERKGTDLVVMGGKGRNAIERALVGSVTARIISIVDCDILVVPCPAKAMFKKVLFTTDGSKFSQIAGKKAMDYAKAHDSGVVAMAVVDVTEEFYAQAPEAVENMIEKAWSDLREFKNGSDLNIEMYVKEGEAYKKIVETSQKTGADLIFMGSHGRTGVGRLLMGSVTAKVIGHSNCPVLVVKT